MTDLPNATQPLTEPGIANAEDGLVVLDGPNGVAVTMTPSAAHETGNNLISAAAVATSQAAERKDSTGK